MHRLTRSRKCFSTIAGYCKKKCMLGKYMTNHVQKENYVASVKAKNTYQKAIPQQPEPSSKPDLKLDYVILPTVSHLAQFHNKPSAFFHWSPLFFINPKGPLIRRGGVKKLIYYFCELDFPRNKVLYFSLDLFVHVIAHFF